MAQYEWTIRFEAENDDEAKDTIYNENYGAVQGFDSIHRERLVRYEGREIVEVR